MVLALLGGILIGVAASIAHAGSRQVAGVSGHVAELMLRPFGTGKLKSFGGWFVLGLLLGGVLIAALATPIASTLPARPLAWVALSGLLVGFGTRLGGGCTSGHGVCGISRLSPRSFVATGVFMVTAALVVLLTRHVLAAGVVR